jgi:hypothetical protein
MSNQDHHITYKPEWTVSLTGYQHLVVTRMQRLKPTATNYAQAISFLHAVMYECNRLRCLLDRIEDKNTNP